MGATTFDLGESLVSYVVGCNLAWHRMLRIPSSRSSKLTDARKANNVLGDRVKADSESVAWVPVSAEFVENNSTEFDAMAWASNNWSFTISDRICHFLHYMDLVISWSLA